VIESNVTIDQSVICDNVVIGAGAVIPRGCVLSYGVVIGAGAVLKEYTRVSRHDGDDEVRLHDSLFSVRGSELLASWFDFASLLYIFAGRSPGPV